MRSWLFTGFFAVLLFVPQFALAQSNITDPIAGLRRSARVGELIETESEQVSVVTTAGNIIGAALSFIAVLFFIMVVYGGFIWMTARGNEQMVDKGKESVIAAVIGIVIVFGAYAITNLVFNSTGASPPSQPTGIACNASTPCADGFQCQQGVCRALPQGYCEQDQQCGVGQRCRNNICEQNPDLFDLGLDVPIACDENTDCGPGNECVQGQCVRQLDNLLDDLEDNNDGPFPDAQDREEEPPAPAEENDNQEPDQPNNCDAQGRQQCIQIDGCSYVNVSFGIFSYNGCVATQTNTSCQSQYRSCSESCQEFDGDCEQQCFVTMRNCLE